ncbi:MAG: DnaK suppressor protein [Rhodothermales bacterium]|jgi:DnaK suppressor protein
MSSALNPDDPAATYGDRAHHYHKLVELRDSMIHDVRALSDRSLSSTKSAGQELADVGSENFLREMELSLVSEEGRKINAILRAIRCLNDASFGICEDCEKPISEGRLNAMPYAKLCVSCKSAREENGGLPPFD